MQDAAGGFPCATEGLTDFARRYLLPAILLLLTVAASTITRGAPEPSRYVRARGDRFELVDGAMVRPMFIRGVNMGAAPPGHFPGESRSPRRITYAGSGSRARFTRTDPRLRASSSRALPGAEGGERRASARSDLALPGSLDRAAGRKRLLGPRLHERLRVGDPERHRRGPRPREPDPAARPMPRAATRRTSRRSRRLAPGDASGKPYAVRDTERRHPSTTAFHGKFFTVESGTAMECWLGKELDLAASYEASRYGLARAVSFVNWPTLDVMRHPTEYERGGRLESTTRTPSRSIRPGSVRTRQPLRGTARSDTSRTTTSIPTTRTS